MLKRVFIVVVIILAFLVASVYIFRANIKQYAVTTILRSFPLPNVALANVNFDETTGKLNLEEVKVKNPKGFKNKYIMEANSVDMDISFVTKPNLRLNISNIDITDPVFYVERSSNGKWNFQEYGKKDKLASLPQKESFDIIKRAFAEEAEKKSKVVLPRNIYINNGVVYLLDNFITYGKTHIVNFFPLTGTISLHYLPEKNKYEKIRFNGSCNIDGDVNRVLKGDLEIYPAKDIPAYIWKFNAYNVPLATIKPYLDRYTPFIVKQGSFNMASTLKSEGGLVEGGYTMELMDLDFAINPKKSNIPFLETSAKKLTMYLTNQKGNVVIDFKQKGKVGEEIRWSLGPITKRAIGLMTIDTVIEVIEKIEKGREKGDVIKEFLPEDVPPEVVDIFRGIFK